MMPPMTTPQRQPRLTPFGGRLRELRKAAGLRSVHLAAAATKGNPEIETLTEQQWLALEHGRWADGSECAYRMEWVIAAADTVGMDRAEAFGLTGLRGAAPKIERMSDARLMAAIRSLPEDLRSTVQGVVEVCQRAMRADEGEP